MAKSAIRSETAAATSAKPEVRGRAVPYLTVEGATRAAAFYAAAFGAQEVARHPVDEQGRTMHIHLYINGGSVMLSDAFPEHGYPMKTPQGFSIVLPIDDGIETWWDRAVKAGAKVEMPLQDMFWGDRYGQLRDPFGILWALIAPIR